MKDVIVGRKEEQKILESSFQSNVPEFLAVYGRRRIGKTYLIYNNLKEKDAIFFHVTGVKNGKLQEQISHFMVEIGRTFYNGAPLSSPKSWMGAFDQLTKSLKGLERKVVLFFDELPWLATKRSKILEALDYYWNRYWSFDERIKLIVCGSSSSWIINNIINNRGGLHNRITRIIRLSSFTLGEARDYLKILNIRFDEQQILQLYMTMGGVPHYLKHIQAGLSASQNIDRLCFNKEGLLFKEYRNLFSSLFNNAKIYETIIEAIATSRHGISQEEVFKRCNLPRGGSSLQKIKELEESGFIVGFLPYGHKDKGTYYRIIDEYVLFYLSWIKPYSRSMGNLLDSSGYCEEKNLTPSWKSWSGYAFESVCYKHIDKIKKALEITPGAEVGSWRYVPRSKVGEEGAQIDLLFDRSDGVVTVCEIKYNVSPFCLDKTQLAQLKRKVEVYKAQTKIKKQIFLSLITAGGLKTNDYAKEFIASFTVLEDLF
jgi:AAA+ ATPase superfamily predicted ATPase